jgi:predicted TIM-barrel fold metal-dependent hydrolase
MVIIDSQVHAYEANTPKRPWHTVPNWPDHVTGDEMVAAMDKVGVHGAIFISAFSLYRYDASYAVASTQSEEHPINGEVEIATSSFGSQLPFPTVGRCSTANSAGSNDALRRRPGFCAY